MTTVYYLGPTGSFSAILAAQEFSSAQYTLTPCNSFSDILQKVYDNQTGLGVLPIENSITSNVHENVDSLFSKRLHIVGEAYLEVRLHALGLQNAKLDEASKVYSHPKALQQCSQWISKHKLETVVCNSTSEAKDLVLEEQDPKNLVIGATTLVKSGLTLLEEGVGNVKKNTTRFVFVSQDKAMLDQTTPNKVSLNFKAPHKPGSLALVLGELADLGVNLTKIVSQPIPGSDFEYRFWIDLVAEPELIEKAIASIDENTPEHTIIGTYHQGKRYPS